MANQKTIKAIGSISGGLDSFLASKLLVDLGVDVTLVHFLMPWQINPPKRAIKISEFLNVKLLTPQLGNAYMEMLRNPKYGYGSAFNPCVSCHAFMFRKAGELMKDLGADFVFSGEVLAQRPMSQIKRNLEAVDKLSGLEGRILRPLSAKLLEPTIPEKEGLIDREKLLGLSGRSRKPQIQLAKQWGITDFAQPGGGCLLTVNDFGARVKDLLDHDFQDYKQMISLQWGRHFRINDQFKVILGRDKKENNLLFQYADSHDFIMTLYNLGGPALILKGKNPDEEILSICAGLVQKFSKHKNKTPQIARYWKKNDRRHPQKIVAKSLSSQWIEEIRLK